jgi:hypothetical protein
MTPEGRVKAQVNKLLKEFEQHIWYFMPVQKGMGRPALDYIGCICGKFFAIETKRDQHAKLTPTQQSTKRNIEKAGGQVFVISDGTTLAEAACFMRDTVREST